MTKYCFTGRNGSKLILSSISLVLTLILFSSGLMAHPPSDIDLSYAGASGVLKVEINHRVGNPSRHYIEKLTIMKNGEAVLEKDYEEQESNSGGIYEFQLAAQNGDAINVKAKCNRFGNLSASIEVQGVPVAEKTLLRASLLPNSAVPAVAEPTPDRASGLAIAILDRANNVLKYSITFKGLSGRPTMAHFHRGDKGESGPPVRTIFGKPEIDGAPTGPPEGNSGFITGSWENEGGQALTDELEEAILSGDIYVNIHTELNQGGEVRGQLEVLD